MSTTIKIKAAGRKFDLTPDEARALYDELRKVYDVPFVSVPSVWTWPNGDDLSGVVTSTPGPGGYTTGYMSDTQFLFEESRWIDAEIMGLTKTHAAHM